ARLKIERVHARTALNHLGCGVEKSANKVLFAKREGPGLGRLQLAINPDWRQWGPDFEPRLRRDAITRPDQHILADRELKAQLTWDFLTARDDLNDLLPETCIEEVLRRLPQGWIAPIQGVDRGDPSQVDRADPPGPQLIAAIYPAEPSVAVTS